jgi:hypothetical protein
MLTATRINAWNVYFASVFHQRAPHTGERGTRLTFSTYKAARLNHLNVKAKHLNIKIVDQEVLYLKHLSYTHASYA